MSPSDFRAFYKWIFEYGQFIGANRLELSWFGGEPLLLGQRALEEALSMQIDYFDSSKMPFVNRMQSNLVLVDERTCELLLRWFDGTIGGSFEPCGIARRYPNGDPATSIIERKIDYLRNQGIRVGIVSTLMRADLVSPAVFYQWFHNRVDAVRVNRAHPPPGADSNRYLDLPEYTEYVLELLNLYVNDPHPECDFTNFTSVMRTILLGQTLECVSATEPEWKIAVSGGGILTSCCRKNEVVLGNVYDDSPADVVASYRSFAHPVSLVGKCRKCNFRSSNLCSGACLGEPNCDCKSSECGYRTEYTIETLAFVRDFLQSNGIKTLNQAEKFWHNRRRPK
ncbi:MAG: hypothetical protein IJP65_00265 [Bacteroidales bacterium]|nr:hypothetical protein [Bacteroidales bacterium]